MKKKTKVLSFLVVCLMCNVVIATAEMIENETVRVRTEQRDGGITLVFQTRAIGGKWQTVLSTAAQPKGAALDQGERTATEDIEIDATQADYAGRERLFTEAVVEPDGKTLVVRGRAGIHHLTQRITLKGADHLYVTVEDAIKDREGDLEIGRLMNHFYFVPDNQATGDARPMDFAWLPHLHLNDAGVCGDTFFRSPAVIVVADGVGAAIVPDLNVLATDRKVPHALDLRPNKSNGAGQSVMRLSYGLCPYRMEGHVYTAAEAGPKSPPARSNTPSTSSSGAAKTVSRSAPVLPRTCGSSTAASTSRTSARRCCRSRNTPGVTAIFMN